MPAPFSASSTLPIAALLASDASFADLASLATPASICARSGAAEIVASPLTEMADGKSSARTGVASSVAAQEAARKLTRDVKNTAGFFIGLTSAARKH